MIGNIVQYFFCFSASNSLVLPNVHVLFHAIFYPAGITALGLLVQVDTQYTLEHQLVVIDCLDDPDDTLKRKVTL